MSLTQEEQDILERAQRIRDRQSTYQQQAQQIEQRIQAHQERGATVSNPTPSYLAGMGGAASAVPPWASRRRDHATVIINEDGDVVPDVLYGSGFHPLPGREPLVWCNGNRHVRKVNGNDVMAPCDCDFERVMKK